MESDAQWSVDPLIMSLNALCTFALNVSVFLVILHTSALTIRVAGVVKDFVVVLVSALLFSDVKLTFINMAGYCLGSALPFFPGYSYVCPLLSIVWWNMYVKAL